MSDEHVDSLKEVVQGSCVLPKAERRALPGVFKYNARGKLPWLQRILFWLLGKLDCPYTDEYIRVIQSPGDQVTVQNAVHDGMAAAWHYGKKPSAVVRRRGGTHGGLMIRRWSHKLAGDDFGWIEIRQHRTGPGRGVVSHRHYTWQGPPKAVIDCRFLEDALGKCPQTGEVIRIGPYWVRVGERRYVSNCFVVYRLTPGGMALLVQSRMAMAWQWLTTRLIWTLAVWGLADWPPSYRPAAWRDVWEFWRTIKQERSNDRDGRDV